MNTLRRTHSANCSSSSPIAASSGYRYITSCREVWEAREVRPAPSGRSADGRMTGLRSTGRGRRPMASSSGEKHGGSRRGF